MKIYPTSHPYNDAVFRRNDETIIARASLELHSALYGDNNWNLVNDGILYLMQKQNVQYVILIDPETNQPIWQREINRTIMYKIDKPYFHILSLKNELYGLNFVDLTEAEMFSFAIERLWPLKHIGKMIGNFTSKLTTYFFRKKIPPTPSHKYEEFDCKSGNNLDQCLYNFHSDKVTSMPILSEKRNAFQLNYETNLTPENLSKSYRFKHERIPKPPPLPPPVQHFYVTSTLDKSRTPGFVTPRSQPRNSFKTQIKNEAIKRNVGSSNFCKYLP